MKIEVIRAAKVICERAGDDWADGSTYHTDTAEKAFAAANITKIMQEQQTQIIKMMAALKFIAEKAARPTIWYAAVAREGLKALQEGKNDSA